MKVALLGDVHFGWRNSSAFFLQHQIDYFDKVFFPYLVKNKIKRVFQFADLFDNRKFINVKTLNKAKKHFFSRFDELGIKLDTIIGNHDTYNKNTNEINSVETLLDNLYTNINIITDPTVLKYGNTSALAVPWINQENSEEINSAMDKSTADLLFGHFEIMGFTMVNGIDCESGLDASTMKHFQSVYSGHFHIGSQHGNIRYLGIPYQLDWNDFGDTKGFWVLDTLKDNEVEFVENTTKIFDKIYYDDLAVNYDDFDVEPYTNGIVKVFVREKEDELMLDRFLHNLDTVAYELQISDTMDYEADEDGDSEVMEIEDTLSVLIKTVDTMKTPLSKNDIKMTINNIYEEAQDSIL